MILNIESPEAFAKSIQDEVLSYDKEEIKEHFPYGCSDYFVNEKPFYFLTEILIMQFEKLNKNKIEGGLERKTDIVIFNQMVLDNSEIFYASCKELFEQRGSFSIAIDADSSLTINGNRYAFLGVFAPEDEKRDFVELIKKVVDFTTNWDYQLEEAKKEEERRKELEA